VSLPLVAARSILKPPLGFNEYRHGVYQGLSAAYILNEGGGATLVDGAQHTTAALTGTYNWVTGRNGPAINFNGGVATGPTTKLDPFSWAFWAYFTTNAPGHQCIIAKSDGAQAFGTLAPGHGWCIENNGGTGIQLNVANAAGVARLFVNALPTLNAWHFYVVFWDQTGNMSAPHAGIYTDGKLSNSGNSAVALYTSDSTESLVIGEYNGATNACSNAIVDSVLMWNRVLSGAEVADLYAATYPAIKPRYYPAAGAPSKTFAATSTQKTGTLGREIFVTLAAAKHTFQGALTTKLIQFKTLTATAAQKAGSLVAFKIPSQIIAAQMLQRTGTLNREIFKTLAATKATFQGVLSATKANKFALTATSAQKAGVLSFQTDIGSQVHAVKASFQGKLTLVVRHVTPPPVPTPVVCPTIVPSISHVETCENTGS
jgi:Concanavalin A-like lectin/glucanases superfamily